MRWKLYFIPVISLFKNLVEIHYSEYGGIIVLYLKLLGCEWEQISKILPDVF